MIFLHIFARLQPNILYFNLHQTIHFNGGMCTARLNGARAPIPQPASEGVAHSHKAARAGARVQTGALAPGHSGTQAKEAGRQVAEGGFPSHLRSSEGELRANVRVAPLDQVPSLNGCYERQLSH